MPRRRDSERAHFHADRPFGAAVDELVDVRIAGGVDLRGGAGPDDAAAMQILIPGRKYANKKPCLVR